MTISITDERRDEILHELKGFFEDEFDEPISDFRAENLLAFFVQTLGPTVYNQAIQDARAFMAERLEDLDATFHQS